MEYRCVATSVEGFVQQLAVAYVTHGYWFYVMGQVPEDKNPAAVDRKLVERYGIAISKWVRARRKRQGLANMQYLRYERSFVLLATRGRHEFFQREQGAIRDIRRVPIKFAGYSISCRKGRDGRWHASVRIRAEEYKNLKAYLVNLAAVGTRVRLTKEFDELCREPLCACPTATPQHPPSREPCKSTRVPGVGPGVVPPAATACCATVLRGALRRVDHSSAI